MICNGMKHVGVTKTRMKNTQINSRAVDTQPSTRPSLVSHREAILFSSL